MLSGKRASNKRGGGLSLRATHLERGLWERFLLLKEAEQNNNRRVLFPVSLDACGAVCSSESLPRQDPRPQMCDTKKRQQIKWKTCLEQHCAMCKKGGGGVKKTLQLNGENLLFGLMCVRACFYACVCMSSSSEMSTPPFTLTVSLIINHWCNYTVE